MKRLTVIWAGIMLGTQLYADMTVSPYPVKSANQFPPKANNNAGTLALDTSKPSGPTLLTIQGGVSQGIPSGTGIGEVFKWSGNRATLSSIDFVAAGSGGKGVYQVFLLDLGSGTFSTANHPFDPANHNNLFDDTDTFTITNTDEKKFVELNFTGADRITLENGESYAFGLLSTSSESDLTILRSGGGASDAYGVGFTADSLSDTSANVSAFSPTGVRNIFVGIYIIPIAPPKISRLGIDHEINHQLSYEFSVKWRFALINDRLLW